MQDQQDSNTVSFCPSFNTYSFHSEIAAKVIKELSPSEADQDYLFKSPRNDEVYTSSDSDDDQNDDGFEFVLVGENGNETVFPLFNRDLLLSDNNKKKSSEENDEGILLPLKKLFLDDQSPSSSSSSEVDELEGVEQVSYCFWTPSKSPSASPSPSRCKKSNSTGSSSKQQQQQKWRLKDLLHLKRSHSDGKESFIFLNSSGNKEIGKNVNKVKEKGKNKEKEKIVPAHKIFYLRNKALKDGDKRRKSYLPYRQGLVGFFVN